MKKNILSQGAEAIIYFYKKDNLILKKRIPKDYRIKQIDEKLRKRRTKSEKKILEKASRIINVPKIYLSEDFEIKMEFIPGDRISEELNNYDLKKQKKVCFNIGENVAKLHSKEIIHGDLTTSNMILINKTERSKLNQTTPTNKSKRNTSLIDNPFEIYLIDFGLSFQNGKYEDKAVDLHLFKQALEAKHFKNHSELYKEFQKGYSSINKTEAEKVFNQLNKVEKRGRYKH